MFITQVKKLSSILKQNILATKLLLVILLVVLADRAPAQTSTGEISITVLDPTSAVVPGAKVSIKGANTGNIIRTVQTSGQGLASAPLLPPGTYNLEISVPGFKRSERTGIQVSVGQTADLRIQLETGSTQESITVSGQAPLVEDKTTTLTQVISQQQMLSVPLNGRNYLAVANLTPGAVPSVGSKDSTFSAYGNTGLQNAFLLDGARNVSYLRGLDNFARDMVRPPLDTLTEFSVQTSNFSAEYGASAGAVVNAITKSGTNELHGSGYDFLRNDKLDASDFFALAGSKPLLVQNQYGGSLGGPIKKDRAWIFGGYEQLHTRSEQTGVSAVPPAASRTGNFGATPIYDPFSTVANPAGSGYVRSRFPNNTIPTSAINPITAQLLNSYPEPNVPGSATLFSYNSPQLSSSQNGVVRGDVQVTSKDAMFARFSVQRQSLTSGAALPLPTQTPINRDISSYGIGYGYTRAFNATLVNEARFAWTSIDLRSDATQARNEIIPGALDPQLDSSIPQFNISGFSTIGAQASCCTNSPLHKTSGNWDVSDNLSKMVGTHSLKMGAEIMLIRPSTEAALSGRGTFGFTGVFTQNPPSRTGSGSPVADFLLGTANSVTAGTIGQAVERGWYGGGYFQDDWTVSSRLTVNLGVRYEYTSPYTEVNNRMANFITTPGDPQYGSLILSGDYRKPRALITADKTNFAPRVGFAYRVPGVKNLVVRSSFGIFYAQDPGIGVGQRITNNPPFFGYGALSIVSDQISPSTGFVLSPNASLPRPAAINPNNFVLIPSATSALQSWADHMSTPYVEEWNFTIEKQLPWSMLWETSYVGNTGVHLWSVAQANQPVTNGPGSPTTRRPLAGYTVAGINQTAPWGTSSYEGLSTKLEKRFSAGVSFLAAFTYGRALDFQDANSLGLCISSSGCGGGGDAVQNSYNRRTQRGPSDNDVPLRFSLGGGWALPFGRGKAYLRDGWGAALAGGWELSTIYQVQTGAPFTPILSFDNANAGNTSWPNRVCNGNLSSRGPSHWFDQSCFVAPSQYQFGNTGRNVLYGPGLNSLDLGLHRDFRMPIEHPTNLQFRAEAFNTLNHPQFAQPGSTVGSSTFGVVTATSVANRQLQFALRLSF